MKIYNVKNNDKILANSIGYKRLTLDKILNKIVGMFPVVSGSGENITLNDTADMPMSIIPGPSEIRQETTTGKNKWNNSGLIERTTNGITYTPVYDDNGQLLYVNANGTATSTSYFNLKQITLPVGNYVLNGSKNGTNQTYNMVISIERQILQTSVDVSFELTEEGTSYENYIRVQSGVTVSNVKFYPMIRLASVKDDTYEPYTNGASPNPEFPQQIQVVSGDNVIHLFNKNLFDKDHANVLNCSITTNNLNFQPSQNAKTLYIKCLPNTTYTITKISSQRFIAGGCAQLPADNVICSSISTNIVNNAITHTTGTNDKYLVVYYYLNGTDTLTEQEILDSIQIEEGTSITSYVAHQEQNFPLNLGVENLFNKNDVLSGRYDSNGNFINEDYWVTNIIQVLPNHYYTFSGVRAENSNVYQCEFDENMNFIGVATYLKNGTIKTSANCKYINATIQRNDMNNFQVEPGAKTNSYSPYGQEPVEYCKMSNTDYSDEFINKNGLWYIKKNVKKIILTGNEQFLYESNFFNITNGSDYGHVPNAKCLSNYFRNVYDENHCIRLGNSYFVQIRYDEIDNLQDFIKFVKDKYNSGNPIEVYYPLSESEYIPLNDTLQSQLNAIEAALSYQGQTNISQENNDLPFVLEAEACLDLNKLINTEE